MDFDIQSLVLCLVIAVSILCIVKGRKWLGPSSKRTFDSGHLDAKLLQWPGGDVYKVRDLLNGGAVIFGRSGAGKTSSSGRMLLNAIANHAHSGGLILAAKPEDVDDVRQLFARVRRSGDLYVVHPEGELRLNFIDYVRRMGGDAREITKCISTIGETLRGADAKGRGENSDFWEKEQERQLYNAVEALRLGTGVVSAPEIQRFISTAAFDPKMLSSDGWKTQFHNQVMSRAFHAKKTDIEQKDFELISDYWCAEFPSMAPVTRSSIMTGVMSVLHVFNTGIVRSLASGETNISPDEILQGKWLLVNMPPAQWGDSGAFINAGWKYLMQKAVLRRKAGPRDPINVIWIDEAQQFTNSFDSHYLAQCRSHLGCMVFLTQSLHSVFAALKGQNGMHQGRALLTNFSLKVFHALGSPEDATYASGLIGNAIQSFINGSIAPAEDLFDSMFGLPKITSSFNENLRPIIEPNVFMNGLRCGGEANGFHCDAIVVKSGEAFRNGQNWKMVSFSQR